MTLTTQRFDTPVYCLHLVYSRNDVPGAKGFSLTWNGRQKIETVAMPSVTFQNKTVASLQCLEVRNERYVGLLRSTSDADKARKLNYISFYTCMQTTFSIVKFLSKFVDQLFFIALSKYVQIQQSSACNRNRNNFDLI